MGHNRVVNKRTKQKIIIMTKTTTVASKAFVAIVAAAMVFSLIAPAAKAATMTSAELQAQITALMAQIAGDLANLVESKEKNRKPSKAKQRAS